MKKQTTIKIKDVNWEEFFQNLPDPLDQCKKGNHLNYGISVDIFGIWWKCSVCGRVTFKKDETMKLKRK